MSSRSKVIVRELCLCTSLLAEHGSTTEKDGVRKDRMMTDGRRGGECQRFLDGLCSVPVRKIASTCTTSRAIHIY